MRKNAERDQITFTQFPPIVTSYKHIVQYIGHWYSQAREHSLHKDPSRCFFIAIATSYSPSLSPQSLTSGWSVLHFYNFVILRMLYKWSHMARNLVGWAYFTLHHFLKSHWGAAARRRFSSGGVYEESTCLHQAGMEDQCPAQPNQHYPGRGIGTLPGFAGLGMDD